tara:strand:+ start:53 stop:232 length:180 start_codon:yes stop_codon:yes gene_type:complete
VFWARCPRNHVADCWHSAALLSTLPPHYDAIGVPMTEQTQNTSVLSLSLLDELREAILI